jgi:hypothetical protein
MTHKAHRRQVLWQVILPLVLGVVIVLVFAVLASLAGDAEASLWADISIIFLLIPLMAVSLLFVLLFSGMVYVLLRLLRIIPSYARKAQVLAFKVEQRARKVANLAAEPILRYHSFVAAMRALRQR